jgi:ribosomal protein S18 acetylase RimI-like enzyme
VNVTLRPARSTDAGAVAAILSGFIDDTPWMPRVHTRAEDLSFAGMMIDRGWCSVAEADDRVVGFLSRDGAMIHALYLRPDFCGQGIGRELLGAAKAASTQLKLYTFQANTGAQRFYLREGFTEVQRSDGAGNDEGLPDIEYHWSAKETP